MNQKFKEYIKNHIREYLPQDYQNANVILKEIIKGNDRALTGLIIRKDNEKVTPVIYLEPYEAENKKGRSLDDIMREIAKIMENSLELSFHTESLNDYETVRPMLTIRLCDPEKNKEYLKGKPYTLYGELAATYQVQFIEHKEGSDFAVITDDTLKLWGITPEQLHHDAVNAENVRNPACLYDIEDLIILEGAFSYIPANLFERPELKANGFVYVLTNQTRIYGAGVLARDGVLDRVGELIGSDFYVLPSSIHEVLIIQDDGKMTEKELENIVREVNATHVAPGDLLSDKVQHYDRVAKTLGRKQTKKPM